MTSITFTNTAFKYGETEIDIGSLPEASIRALISRGLTHFLGSEQASKVKSAKDKHLADTKEELGEADVASLKASFVASAIEALKAGTIGQRAVGTTVDPLEALCEKIAKSEVLDILRANGIKVPKKGEAVVFANGATKTIDEMVATRLEKNGEAIEKAAKKQLADAKRKSEALKAGGEVTDASDLGL